MYGINNNGELIVNDPWTGEKNPLRVSIPESPDNSTVSGKDVVINGSKKSDINRIIEIQNYASEDYPGSEIDLFLSQLVFMRSWYVLEFVNKESTEKFNMSTDVIRQDIRGLNVNTIILVPAELVRLIDEIQSRLDWEIKIEELVLYLSRMVENFSSYQNNWYEWITVKAYLLNVLNNRLRWKIITLL